MDPSQVMPTLLGTDTESQCEHNNRPHKLACLKHRGALSVLAGLLVVAAVAATTIGRRSRPAPGVSSSDFIMEAAPVDSAGDGHNSCSRLPYLDIVAVLHNNLGNAGPDVGAEGIFYKVRTNHVALSKPGSKEGWLRLRATTPYTPYWPADNGIKGTNAAFNIKAGTSVGLVLEAYDPDTDKPVEIPHGSLTFFDVDEGPGHTGREYINANGFENYYVANGTEVYVEDKSDGSKTFMGTQYSEGTDNPTTSWVLDAHQKKKAVTLEFERERDVRFTVGATDGNWPRYFEFAATPSVVCAQTMLPDGRLVGAGEDVAGNPRPRTNNHHFTQEFGGVPIKDLQGPGSIDEFLAEQKRKRDAARREALAEKNKKKDDGSAFGRASAVPLVLALLWHGIGEL